MDAKDQHLNENYKDDDSSLATRLKKKGGAAREKIISATKTLAKRPGRGVAKGEAARKKILAAARVIFARHPYNAASIRMIAREGGFDHPLIHYYFPTKALLFEEVAKQMFEEFLVARDFLQKGMEDLEPVDRLYTFVDRALEYGFSNHETLGVLMQNMAQTGRLDEIPGYHYIPEVFTNLRVSIIEKFPTWISEDETDRLIYSFTTLIFVYLGTTCQAQVMDMDFGSDAYRKWVRDTLLTLFQPHLEKMLALHGKNPEKP